MAKAQKKSVALNIKSQPTRTPVKAPAQKTKSTKSVPSSALRPAPAAETIAEAAVTVRRHSKQATLITLLRRAEGATLEELTATTGWQRHSVRGVISGVVKKRLGFVIASNVEERGRIYRIAGERR